MLCETSIGSNALFAAQQTVQQSNEWLSWTIMFVLYGMLFIAILINREEHGKARPNGFILPSGEVVPPLRTGSTTTKETVPSRTVWEFRIKNLEWWHMIGAFSLVTSIAYGVGIVLFAQIRPDLVANISAAPHAITNAALLFLMLTYAFSPVTPRQRKITPFEQVLSENHPLREVFAARIDTWQPTSDFSPGQLNQYRPNERLDYQTQTDPSESLQNTEVPMVSLFVTLLVSALIAPLLSGLFVGSLYLLKSFDAYLFLPFFAWLSGSLTLLLSLASFAFLNSANKREVHEEQTQKPQHFIFDFEEKNLYMEGLAGMRSCHFQQCSTLLVSHEPPSGLENNPKALHEMPLCVYLYGELMSSQGLLLASFSPQEDEQHYQDCMTFAAMLSDSMDLPLHATKEAPII